MKFIIILIEGQKSTFAGELSRNFCQRNDVLWLKSYSMTSGTLNLKFPVTRYELEKFWRRRPGKWDPRNMNFHKRPLNEFWITPYCSSRRGDQFSYITLCQQRSYAEDMAPRSSKDKLWDPQKKIRKNLVGYCSRNSKFFFVAHVFLIRC